MTRSSTHLVLLPSFNTGAQLERVVSEVRVHFSPVVVVIDGSTDGSERPLLARAERDPELHVLVLPRNQGKGAAVLAGAEWALARGFTHALTMDADGQHLGEYITRFVELSRRNPDALVLGRPIFPANVPRARLHGRKISVALVWLTILGWGIDDPLFGFRVYPLAPLMHVLGSRRTGRRYDFDTEAAVRLCWADVRPINVRAPVRYFSPAEGGVSHYRYVRDNLVLARMHVSLLAELLLVRAPDLLRHRRRWRAATAGTDPEGALIVDGA